MLGYRCYFLGQNGRIAARREFHAIDDAEAVRMARVFYSEQLIKGLAYGGFEVWQESRPVPPPQARSVEAPT
jgi:hypothetical protein